MKTEHINENINYIFNGVLYLVRHNDMGSQFIGSGDTLDKALKDAENSRHSILKHRQEKEEKARMSKIEQLLLSEINSEEIEQIKKEYPENYSLYVKYLYSGIPKIYMNINWEDCYIDKTIVGLVKKYINNFKEAFKCGQGIIFTGTNGVGKSTLSCLIAKEAIKLGYSVKYIAVSKIIDYIMSAINDKNNGNNFEKIFSSVDFIILDDLGKEYKGVKGQLNTLVSLKLDMMLRERVNKSLITIGSTNYDEQSLKDIYGESVLSIIYGACKIIEVKGRDFRKIQGKSFWDKLEKE